MLKSGSQVHAILTCLKFREEQGRNVRYKELITIWPKIGLSTLPNLLVVKRKDRPCSELDRPHMPLGPVRGKIIRQALVQRLSRGVYTLTKAGEQELQRLGKYTIQMWNPNASPNTPLPWESTTEMVVPNPMEVSIIDCFLRPANSDMLQFYQTKEEAEGNAPYENRREPCKNPACGHKMMSVTRLYQNPKFETAILSVTILTCRLCGNEVLDSMLDVSVDEVPPLESL